MYKQEYCNLGSVYFSSCAVYLNFFLFKQFLLQAVHVQLMIIWPASSPSYQLHPVRLRRTRFSRRSSRRVADSGLGCIRLDVYSITPGVLSVPLPLAMPPPQVLAPLSTSIRVLPGLYSFCLVMVGFAPPVLNPYLPIQSLQARRGPFFIPLVDFLYQSRQRIHHLRDEGLEGL